MNISKVLDAACSMGRVLPPPAETIPSVEDAASGDVFHRVGVDVDWTACASTKARADARQYGSARCGARRNSRILGRRDAPRRNNLRTVNTLIKEGVRIVNHTGKRDVQSSATGPVADIASRAGIVPRKEGALR